MKTHHTIDYIELPSSNLASTKQFFESVFEWTFQNYGPDYAAFSSVSLQGGFLYQTNPL